MSVGSSSSSSQAWSSRLLAKHDIPFIPFREVLLTPLLLFLLHVSFFALPALTAASFLLSTSLRHLLFFMFFRRRHPQDHLSSFTFIRVEIRGKPFDHRILWWMSLTDLQRLHITSHHPRRLTFRLSYSSTVTQSHQRVLQRQDMERRYNPKMKAAK